MSDEMTLVHSSKGAECVARVPYSDYYLDVELFVGSLSIGLVIGLSIWS